MEIVVDGFVKHEVYKRALRCIYGMKVNDVLPENMTWNSIIFWYARDGQFETAYKYFYELGRWDNVEANVVSWTMLATGHEQNENFMYCKVLPNISHDVITDYATSTVFANFICYRLSHLQTFYERKFTEIWCSMQYNAANVVKVVAWKFKET